MPNTYTQLYIQFIFAVQHRDALIKESFREELQKYMTGIAQDKKHKLLSIYAMPDHAHVLVGLNPVQSISSLASDLKSNSSKWINENRKSKFHFNWQEGYGAFSYNKEMMYVVANYIQHQKEHHKKKTFKEEYLSLLHEFDVEYNSDYLFDFFE